MGQLNSTCTALTVGEKRLHVLMHRLLLRGGQVEARGRDQRLAVERGVAVQFDPLESKGLKPVLHLIGSRGVETMRFQALWVNWIQLAQPPPWWCAAAAQS